MSNQQLLLNAVQSAKIEDIKKYLIAETYHPNFLKHLISTTEELIPREEIFTYLNQSAKEELLFESAKKGNISLVKFLINKQTDFQENNARKLRQILSFAVAYKHIDLAKTLVLDYHVDPKEVDPDGTCIFQKLPISLLSDFSEKGQTSVATFLVQQGALEIQENLDRMKEAVKTFEVDSLTSTEPVNTITQTFSKAVVDFIDSQPDEKISLALKQLSVSCAAITRESSVFDKANSKYCAEEKSIFKKLPKLFKNYQKVVINEDQIRKLAKDTHFASAYVEIAKLLQNIPLCINILKDSLEKDIADYYQSAGIDISSYLSEVKEHVFVKLPWPILDSTEKVKTHNILGTLLLKKERDEKINCSSDAPPTYAGLIETETFYSYLKEYLAQDFNYIGNLLHNKYAHRLQWYIIMTAAKKGYIDLQNIPIKTLLSNSAEVWGILVDAYQAYELDNPNTPFPLGFRAPVCLHSILLSSNEDLPALCGTLRKIFAQSLAGVSKQHSATEKQICAEYDIIGAYSFYSFRKNSSTTIQEYYEKKGKLDRIKVDSLGKSGYGSVFFKRPKEVIIEDLTHLKPEELIQQSHQMVF